MLEASHPPLPSNDTSETSCKLKNIAIIGGGPAGAATALSLLKAGKYNVHVFDANQGAKIKIGESIPPAASAILKRLGQSKILSDADHLDCTGSVSVWGDKTPGHNDFWLVPVGKGFHLDRYRFDQQMKTAAETLGARWFEGWQLRSVARRNTGFKLQFHLVNGSQRQLHFDFVVDASGQAASFARKLGVVRNVFDEVLCLCAIFSLPKNSNMTNRSLVEAVDNGWWYAARLPGERVIISLTSDVEIIKAKGLKDPQKWNDELLKSQFIKKQLPSKVLQQLPELQVKVARSSILSGVMGEDWLAVGDAACSYDPLTSAGITKALMHGELAGVAIDRAWQSKHRRTIVDYQTKVFEQFNQYVSLRNQLYRAETRFHKQPFWKNRLFLQG